MELAIATDYDGEFRRNAEIRQSLKDVADAGFTHVHWCFEWASEYLYNPCEMQQIREWLDEYGLKEKSLHASHGGDRKNYLSACEYNRKAGVELVENRVDLVHALGGTEIVLHMYLPYEDFEKDPSSKDRFYAIAERSLNELMPHCREKNVRICLENLFEAPGYMQKEQFSHLLEKYPADFLGLCVDTGHAHLVWNDDFVKELMLPFRDRIYSMHMHDNYGWTGRRNGGDAHRIPGTCNINWQEVMDALGRSAYELPLTLELSYHRDEETRQEFLARAYKSGEWLYSMMK